MNNGMKKALIIGFVVVSIIILVWYLQLYNYFTLGSLQSQKTYLERIVARNYWKAVAIFVAMYTIIIALAMPVVPPLTIVGGFLFGFIPAGFYASISATVGATLSFLLMKYVLSNVIRGKYAQKLERFNKKIASHGAASYLITLQLMGLIPYFIINALAALANVSTYTFIWTTFIGSMPIMFIYAFAGSKLYSVESVDDIFSPSIIALLLFLMVISLLPLVIKSFGKDKDLE